jgi:chemotaxis protein histidine kinase CheA
MAKRATITPSAAPGTSATKAQAVPAKGWCVGDYAFGGRFVKCTINSATATTSTLSIARVSADRRTTPSITNPALTKASEELKAMDMGEDLKSAMKNDTWEEYCEKKINQCEDEGSSSSPSSGSCSGGESSKEKLMWKAIRATLGKRPRKDILSLIGFDMSNVKSQDELEEEAKQKKEEEEKKRQEVLRDRASAFLKEREEANKKTKEEEEAKSRKEREEREKAEAAAKTAAAAAAEDDGMSFFDNIGPSTSAPAAHETVVGEETKDDDKEKKRQLQEDRKGWEDESCRKRKGEGKGAPCHICSRKVEGGGRI